MSNLNRGHSIDDSYQVSVVAMFANDQDEMSNLHRGHSIDASYQVSVHLAKRFQRRRLLEIDQSETRIALWWPCLLMDRDEMSNRYTGPPIDQFYKV